MRCTPNVCDLFLAVGVVPVALLNADKGRIGCLPEGLPMLRTGVTDTWKNQEQNWPQDERANAELTCERCVSTASQVERRVSRATDGT